MSRTHRHEGWLPSLCTRLLRGVYLGLYSSFSFDNWVVEEPCFCRTMSNEGRIRKQARPNLVSDLRKFWCAVRDSPRCPERLTQMKRISQGSIQNYRSCSSRCICGTDVPALFLFAANPAGKGRGANMREKKHRTPTIGPQPRRRHNRGHDDQAAPSLPRRRTCMSPIFQAQVITPVVSSPHPFV